MNESESFLSIKEFAGLLGVHPNTVRRAIKSGRVMGFKLGEGRRSVYRIPRTEINKVALYDLEDMIVKIITQKKLV